LVIFKYEQIFHQALGQAQQAKASWASSLARLELVIPVVKKKQLTIQYEIL